MLVDDAFADPRGFARLLRDEGIAVVARHADALDIVAAVGDLRPDVVIMDVRMRPTHTTEGLQAVKKLKERHPDVGVLVLSQYVETLDAMNLLRGAHGGVG